MGLKGRKHRKSAEKESFLSGPGLSEAVTDRKEKLGAWQRSGVEASKRGGRKLPLVHY